MLRGVGLGSVMECSGCCVLSLAAAKICVPLIFMCSLSFTTRVSLCKCSIGVVSVQPVMIRKALFCIVCSVLWCVSERFGAQAVLAYSRTDLMYCL